MRKKGVARYFWTFVDIVTVIVQLTYNLKNIIPDLFTFKKNTI